MVRKQIPILEQQLLLNGIHCAACVNRIEKALNKVPNVLFASVNLVDQTAFIQGDVPAEILISAVTKIGFGAELLETDIERREKQQAQTQALLIKKKRQYRVALCVGALLMAYGLWQGMSPTLDNRMVWLVWALITALTMLFCGKDFFLNAWISLKNHTATMDSLIALSTGVAWLYSFYLTLYPQVNSHLYYEASIMIIGFINLGKYLELKAKQRSSFALEQLLDLAPQQAVILVEKGLKTIPVNGIKPQMRVQALAGDRLAVDGVLESGSIWVDESMLTGEALPIEKKIGDKVSAGTFIQDGAGVYIAKQVGSQTALARIINAVRHAQSSKPPLAKWVDKIATVFVPFVISIALLSAVSWLWLGKDFAFALSVFTTVLIIACPCALGLAIPLSTIAGVARAAEFGVLVRNIEALQAGSKIDTLVFDKTGTLTTGEMKVVEIKTFTDVSEMQLLQWAKSLEQQASHPIAKAIVRYAESIPTLPVREVKVLKGLGIVGRFDENEVKVGNARFAKKSQNLPACQILATPVFVAVNDQTVGVIYLQDQLREESKSVIQQFQSQGYQCVMLTGDQRQTAEYFADQLGLDSVIAEVLPEQKAEQIKRLQQQGHQVAMMGDGINDAPALAQANVGIAMHNGSDIAVETADLSLMQMGLMPVAKIFPFAQATLHNMYQSLLGAFIYNMISLPIATGVLYPFTGWLLNPMIAAIAMALSSITVVLNSQRLLRWSSE